VNTASQTSTANSDDLNLLREWREPVTADRIVRAGIGALVYHIFAIAFLVLTPGAGPLQNAPRIQADLKKAIPLYLPKELTQRDPNRGKISHDLDVRSAAPAGLIATRIPSPPPLPAPIVPVQVPAPKPIPPAPEQPKAEMAKEATPPNPPPIKAPDATAPPEKPKIAFESVGTGAAPIQAQAPVSFPAVNKPLEEIARSAIPLPPAPPGSVTLGDRDASRLQLLSDPAGVDFKPYLLQILTAVRNNWMSIIPESARLGRRGRVLVQFIIDRRGRMPKIVIAEESGTLAFDRAAIAGVNASVPFPPLPGGYRGDEIRLQLAFTYNMPSR
jgi:periplasmic protein TonB